MLERAHVSKIVKKLQKMELVKITQSNNDKRSQWINVTPKGEQILKECMSAFEKWNNDWISSFDKIQLQNTLENLSYIILQKQIVSINWFVLNCSKLY